MKKHNEIIIKMKECYEENKIKEEQKNQIISASKKANYISIVLTSLISILAIIFLFLSSFALLQYCYGDAGKAARINIAAYILYIFSVLLIFIEKIIGNMLQNRMEKRYLNF